MAPRRQTLLTPGHEEAWARINAEERLAAIPAPDTPVEALLRSGMALSEQAFMLINAIERPDDCRPAPRS